MTRYWCLVTYFNLLLGQQEYLVEAESFEEAVELVAALWEEEPRSLLVRALDPVPPGEPTAIRIEKV